MLFKIQDTTYFYTINEAIKKYTDDKLNIKILLNQTSKDERTKNLNLGIQESQGRFIGFLDDDDIFYSNHISLLINSLIQNKDIAWCYSDVATVICDSDNQGTITQISSDLLYKRDDFSKQELLKDNFIPIHTYILDRSKIDSSLLTFDESLKVMEDYAFLLKIAFAHSPIYLPQVTCEYRFWKDASNTNYHINQILGKNFQKKAIIWSEAAQKIDILKRELSPDYEPGLLSYSTRKMFISKFAYLYKIKHRFPKIWNFFVMSAVKLNLIK